MYANTRCSTDHEVMLTDMDFQSITALFRRIHDDPNCREVIPLLTAVLHTARIVPVLEVPGDVITLNSRVRLRDCNTDTTKSINIVLPEEHRNDRRNLSVATIPGALIIGRRQGDIISKFVQGCEYKYHIERLAFQPEVLMRGTRGWNTRIVKTGR